MEWTPSHIAIPRNPEQYRDMLLGHTSRYPYEFYGLMNEARDPDIKQRCLEIACRIF